MTYYSIKDQLTDLWSTILQVLLVFRAKLKLLLFEEERERERWNKEVVHDLATLCLLLCGYIHRA